ncbi:MAG: hypothetical protein LBS65_06535 [Desulfovibrio sp.]|nr:hypothetical protein [Desulfovibrio sp.]
MATVLEHLTFEMSARPVSRQAAIAASPQGTPPQAAEHGKNRVFCRAILSPETERMSCVTDFRVEIRIVAAVAAKRRKSAENRVFGRRSSAGNSLLFHAGINKRHIIIPFPGQKREHF